MVQRSSKASYAFVGPLASLSLLLLAACGGGGTGVGSSPPPVVTPPAPPPVVTPPPPPTNAIISNLIADQRFASDGTTLDVDLALADAGVGAASSSRGEITVDFDAATKSYTVTQGARTTRFGATDQSAPRFDGEQQFRNSAGQYLTLVTYPYLSEVPNRHVGLGYWQANSLAGGIQDTLLTAFTYGFDTAATDVPRSGSAHFQTDVVGFLAVPGKEQMVVQGLGGFNVDFSLGKYRTVANVNEAAVISDAGLAGSLVLQSAGNISSDGKFNGILTYRGSVSLTGSLSGGFYGPGAAELGATFLASGNGAHLTGAFTGQRSNKTGSSDGVRNLSLTDIVASERLFGSQTNLLWTAWNGRPGFANLVEGRTTGSVDVLPGAIDSINMNEAYRPRLADVLSGDAHSTTYRTTINGNPTTIALYKVGAANPQLQLTYTSFAEWQTSSPTAIPDGTTGTAYDARYMVFGVKTLDELLIARTGRANFSGSVHGTGGNARGQLYDVRGTSRFAVDFSAGAYSGELNLNGVSGDGASRDFGRWTFADLLSRGALVQATLVGPSGGEFGSYIFPQFYGPTGEEIGATFNARFQGADETDRVHIVGVTVAKQD